MALSYKIANPTYPLSRFVKQYWSIDSCPLNGKEHIQRIIPNGLSDLTFYFGNRPKSLDNSKSLQDNTILYGQQKSYFDIVVTGALSIFSISFLPFGANVFFDIPSNELFDQNIPLKYLIKNSVVALESNLFEDHSFEGKIVIVERFLLNLLWNNYKEVETNRMKHSIALINQAKGLINIDTLASASCLSRRQYERVFLSSIGSSPKQFLKTIRFQNSLHLKQMNKCLSLTELTYHSGYYDQSHMINDYRLLSGKTPTLFFSECEAYSDYFL